MISTSQVCCFEVMKNKIYQSSLGDVCRLACKASAAVKGWQSSGSSWNRDWLEQLNSY